MNESAPTNTYNANSISEKKYSLKLLFFNLLILVDVFKQTRIMLKLVRSRALKSASILTLATKIFLYYYYKHSLKEVWVEKKTTHLHILELRILITAIIIIT